MAADDATLIPPVQPASTSTHVDVVNHLLEPQHRVWWGHNTIYKGTCDICGYWTEMCIDADEAVNQINEHWDEWHVEED